MIRKVFRDRKDLHLSRKMFHAGYPVIYVLFSYFFTYKTIQYSVTSISLIIFLCEFLRLQSEKFNQFIMIFFAPLMRTYEVKSYSSLLYYSIGLTFTILLFDEKIAYPTFLIVAFADPMASLMGNLFGKKKFLPNKSYIGSLTCFSVGFLISYLSFPEHGIFFSFIIATSVFLGEMLSFTGIDDNLILPIVTSVSLKIFLSLV